MENGIRVHLWLEQDDWDYIMEKFSDNYGASAAVRTIVHSYIKNLKAKADAKANSLPIIQLDESALRGE